MKIKKRDVQTVLSVAWPSALESFFVALAGMVDTYMVSNLSPNAVAAVGLTTQPKYIGLAPFIAMKIAISAMVARRYGQGERKKANQVLAMGLLFTIIGSLVVSAVSIVFAGPIMNFVGANEDTHRDGVIYFRIIMGGMIFNTVQLAVNAALRGVGNTKIAMRTNVTANIVNIIGNYLLIEGHLGFPALGVAGAAIATVFGTVVACAMSLISVCRKESYVSLVYMMKEKVGMALDQLGSMAKLTGSEFAEQIFSRIGFLLTAMLAANLGTKAFAAHQVGLNVLSLSYSFGDGLAVAAVALIGKSLGEEKPERAKEYGNICLVFGICISLALAVLYLAGGRAFFQLYFDEEEIVGYGVQIMRMTTLIVLVQLCQVVMTGSLRGAGDMIYVMIVGVISISVIRPLFCWLLAYGLNWGVMGIWCGILMDQFTRFVLVCIRYRSGKWMKIKL